MGWLAAASGVIRHRLETRIGHARRHPGRQRRQPVDGLLRRLLRLLLLWLLLLRLLLLWLLHALAPAETDRSEPLQQRQPPFFRALIRQFTALGAQFVLRRDRQFLDPRHARRAHRLFRRRRDEGLRGLLRCRLSYRRFEEQRGLGRSDRTDGDILDLAARQHGGRHRGGRGMLDRGPCAGRHLGALDSFRDALGVGPDPLGQFGDARFRRPCRGRNVIDAGRHHRDADAAFESFVEGRANDDVGFLVDLLADAGRRLVHLVEREVLDAGDRDE